METLAMFRVRHSTAMRWVWLAVLLMLAACNTGDNSGGGGGGY